MCAGEQKLTPGMWLIVGFAIFAMTVFGFGVVRLASWKLNSGATSSMHSANTKSAEKPVFMSAAPDLAIGSLSDKGLYFTIDNGTRDGRRVKRGSKEFNEIKKKGGYSAHFVYEKPDM
jgi:hypothetical protein